MRLVELWLLQQTDLESNTEPLTQEKGDAVQALRVQCDRDLYKKAIQEILLETRYRYF